MTQSRSSDQLNRFKEAARQIETDDDEAKFNATLKRVAKAKVQEQGEVAVWIVSLGNSQFLGKDGKATVFLDDAQEFHSGEKAEAAITPEVRAFGGTGYDAPMAMPKPR